MRAERRQNLAEPIRPDIRPMSASDLDDVLSIEERCFPRPWTRGMFEAELRNPLSSAFIARLESNGRQVIAGYGIFWVVFGEAHILNLAVSPVFRRMGLSAAILEFSIVEMRRKMACEVFLEVRRSNKAARALYKKFGFKESFERANYYGDEDAIVMTREI